MVAYSFQARFVEPILAGTKGGTIRATRNVPRTFAVAFNRPRLGGHAVPGEDLQLYTGMRTKQCRLIARKMCCQVERIRINFSLPCILLGEGHRERLVADLDIFAAFDGFASWSEMATFWRGREGRIVHYSGWHIRWWPRAMALRV